MNQPVNNTTDLEKRIEGGMDKDAMALTNVSNAVGGLAFENMGQVMEFSKLMSVSRQAVPKHLRGQPGACMAVSLQALNWRMDPFAVANKSYSVNDRIVYEAQLIQAVIEQRAPIKGRIKGHYEGEGAKRVCVLRVVSEEDGETIEYRSPEIGSITTKNSPLWKSDPDQQLWYYAARAMCRRHFPDVLLGVYEKEEIKHAEGMRDVTPQEAQGGWAQQARAARGEVIPEDIEDVQPEETHAPDEEQQMQEAVDQDQAPHWTADVDPDEGAPGTDEWNAGVEAFKQGAPITDCPHDPTDPDFDTVSELSKAQDWVGGYVGARRAAE